MKRTKCFLVILLCAALLCGCARSSTLAPASLSESERRLGWLLGLDHDQWLYDFSTGDEIQSIHIAVYRLADGQWERASGGGGYACTAGKGRMALGFDDLAEVVRFAVQGNDMNVRSSGVRTTGSHSDESLSCLAVCLNQAVAIVPDQEIPMALQVFSSQMEIPNYSLDAFHTPEVIAADGHEAVYAVTITFSSEPL